jgi:putative transposase
MHTRKDILAIGEVYHVFNKSIADFKIFNNDFEFLRMFAAIRYYQIEKPPLKFSKFVRKHKENLSNFLHDKEKIVQIIAYCLMPTHIHLILKQLKENGISIFMSNILNSYARYFNVKYKRKGPLWEGRFKNVLVDSDEQLLHLTRYIHLNPVTNYLVNAPEEWLVSSYKEYLSKVEDNDKTCEYDDILNIDPSSYKEFVVDFISYERELSKIKKLLIENH